jgi:hypothetical protein
MGHCNQAVMVTCLYLSHEMTLREVGQYAWALPHPKDPTGSMLRIMKCENIGLIDMLMVLSI